MSDLISREALIDILAKYKFGAIKSEAEREYTKETIMNFVKEQPTVEVVPVVHGEWIADERGIYFCSTCDSEAYWDTYYGQQLFNHCPYCGADMRKKV